MVYGDKLSPETAAWLLTKMLVLPRAPGGERAACGGSRASRCAGSPPRLVPRCGSTSGSPRSAEPSFSFEFFPPRTDEGERNLGRALAELSRLEPTFVSVTYGAAGSTTEKRKTIDIVKHLKRDYGMEAMAHFTCVGATTDELREMLDTMRDAGIENVLALRGDPPHGRERVDRHRGRAELLARADRADPRRVRLLDRRGVLPRGAHPRRRRRERPALPARRRSTRARAS